MIQPLNREVSKFGIYGKLTEYDPDNTTVLS